MSKTERTDGIYILHIADSLQDVIDFLAGKDYSDFVESKLLINAVVRSFEVAGEATKICLTIFVCRILRLTGRGWQGSGMC